VRAHVGNRPRNDTRPVLASRRRALAAAGRIAPLKMLADRILLAPSLAAARPRCNSVRLLTPLAADCYNALNSECYFKFAHFKQVDPEIPGGFFGPFPGACRLYCTRSCALVMHSQAACSEGV
jgi:hypothetical protein